MAKTSPHYFVFDIESVADGRLVAEVRYPGESLTAIEAVNRFRAELLEQYNSDFIPYTFQVPISVAVAKVAADFRLLDLVVLDAPKFRPPNITRDFWRGWTAYKQPTLVTFNGRTFDIPLMELAAFRFGVSAPEWFQSQGPAYTHPRNRYNGRSHFDLHDLLTNFGASRFRGGLNLAANILGKPGKMAVQGHMVQDMYDEGRLAEINDYCRCDVLDTYFVFLRCQVMSGGLSLDAEQKIVGEVRLWLEQRAADIPVYADYLEGWGSWENPWETPAEELEPAESESKPVEAKLAEAELAEAESAEENPAPAASGEAAPQTEKSECNPAESGVTEPASNDAPT